MKYGLFLPNFGAFGEARLLATLAAEAEAAGWDGFFIWDHVARDPAIPGGVVDTQIALAAIAMNTTKIKFGALITPLPRRRPAKVARETVSLQQLSNGRLIFGAGMGSGRGFEWDDLGEITDPQVRGAMLDEGLAVLQGLWSGEPFNYAGRYYQVNNSQFLPAPSSPIPVWVGGVWNGKTKAPFRRAAQWDGVFPMLKAEGQDEISQLREVVAYVRQHRPDERPFEVICEGHSPQADLAAYAEAGATWWLESLRPTYFGTDWNERWNFEAMRERINQAPFHNLTLNPSV